MRIVYCISDHTPAGGTERTLSIQANYFVQKGYDVHIITTELPSSSKTAFDFSEKIQFHCLNINYEEVDNSTSLIKIFKRIQKGKVHKKRLTSLLCTLQPDFTISLFGHEVSFLYTINDKSLKIVQYHFSHHARLIELKSNGSSLFQKCFTLMKERRKQSFINYYDAFVVLTNEDAKTWKKISNIHVIPNAISFTPSVVSSCTNKQILSVGRLTTLKGYDILLQIWSKIANKYPEWHLHIYGKGEDYDKLKQIIQQLGIGNSVQIFPPTNNIIEKYIDSSIYVMTSRSEGFPMVLPEAMICGLPCVSFATSCGPSEIITQGEDGFIVPFGDTQGFCNKLKLLMDNEYLRRQMGEKAHSNIMRYSIDNIMKQWEMLFQQLSNRNSPT